MKYCKIESGRSGKQKVESKRLKIKKWTGDRGQQSGREKEERK